MAKKVVDCFIFFNELELLDIRLHELNEVVDQFVLVEATQTFKGAQKELIYDINKTRYARFNDKIIHVVVNDMPTAEDPRLREHHQRICIKRGLSDLQSEDIVIVSDVDEILRASTINKLRSGNGYFMIDMPMFQFFVNARAIPSGWNKVFAFSNFLMPEIPDFNRIRVLQTETFDRFAGRNQLIPEGGWHFTFLGGEEAVRNKINSYSHTGGYYDVLLNPQNVKEQLAVGYQLGQHDITEFVEIDSSFPRYVQDHVDELTAKGFIKPVMSRVRELEYLYRRTEQRLRTMKRSATLKTQVVAARSNTNCGERRVILQEHGSEVVPEAAVSITEKQKIHLGCGANIIPSWLNTDLNPRNPDVMKLDLTRTFPFDDCSFDLAYSEHAIEHLDFLGGRKMLEETFRVLKPGGRVRISTPDLRTLMDLLADPEDPLNKRYITWSIERFISYATHQSACFVVNNFFRGFSHFFIYDRKTLVELMNRIGFVDFEFFGVKESNTPELRGLERVDRMPDGFLQLETMTIEASKP